MKIHHLNVTLILAIDYTPWGNAIFGTAPIPLAAWLFMLPFALAMLVLEEARKWMVHHRSTSAEQREAVASHHPA